MISRMVVFIPVFLPPMGLNLQYIHYYRLHNFVDMMLSCVLPKNTDVDGLSYLIADF